MPIDHTEFLIKDLTLIRRVDRDLVISELVQYKTVKMVILTVATWASPRGHEKGRFFGIKVRAADTFDHVSRCKYAWITLLARCELAADSQGLFV